MSYLLSIVVPTKDRYFYLKHLIQLVKGFNSKEIELVIQDNTKDNIELLDYLKDNSWDGLKYSHIAEQMPVADNSSLAISNSSGKYVCVIGDDDGVLPKIVDVVSYMETNGIDALVSSSVLYDWPDFTDSSIYQLSSTVQFTEGKGSFFVVKPMKELQKCIKSGIRDICQLPKVYQGIVSRSLLDKVFERTGTFFPGGSPDMANAVSLALLNPKMFFYDSPLIISGQCRTVGGGERLRKRSELLKITEVPFLPHNIAKTWDDRLPRYWCADTIWPQSAISAFKAMNEELPTINFNQIMAIFLFDHPSYYNECRDYITDYISFSYYFIKCFFVKGFRYLYWHVSFLLSGKKKRAGVCIKRQIFTINEAVSYLVSTDSHAKSK